VSAVPFLKPREQTRRAWCRDNFWPLLLGTIDTREQQTVARRRGNGEGSTTCHKKSGPYMARYTVQTPAGPERKTILVHELVYVGHGRSSFSPMIKSAARGYPPPRSGKRLARTLPRLASGFSPVGSGGGAASSVFFYGSTESGEETAPCRASASARLRRTTTRGLRRGKQRPLVLVIGRLVLALRKRSPYREQWDHRNPQGRTTDAFPQQPHGRRRPPRRV
jgi:hypothetical protein